MIENPSRRRLAKVLGASAGAAILGKTLPDRWNKPVIDTVVLPVHAEMTGKKKKKKVPVPG